MSKRTVETEVVINRPLDEVISYVSDMNNHIEWQNGVLESKATSEGPVGVGSTYRYVAQMLGRQIQTEGELTCCDQAGGFKYRSTSGPFQITGGYTFEQTNGSTRVRQQIVADIEGFFSFRR